jgi:2-amino-4-hydroxy-6-hydroxymethyldihydropteridine diphosphokinase
MNEGQELVYVGLGANLGDREESLARAIETIEKDSDLALFGVSSVFETEPVGPPGQDFYLNAVVALRVRLGPLELLVRLRGIERAMGRDRRQEKERWGPRTLDLDILFFGDRQIETPELVIPHVRAHERNFVMAPLAEIAPGLIHPRLGITVAEIALALPDLGSAYVWSDPARWPSGADDPGH